MSIPISTFLCLCFTTDLYCSNKKIKYLFTDDLSFNAIATQSTTQAGPQISYGASNAVDRNKATCTRTDHIGQTSPDKVVWWKVDLGETSNIYSINILFKNYENYGMYHFDCMTPEAWY